MKGDVIQKIGNSIIQHGKQNDRIYLMSLSPEDGDKIINFLEKLTEKNSYTKIFAKVPEFAQDLFIDNGYIIEGILPKYYNGKETCLFMSKFFSEKRKTAENQKELDKVINIAKSKKNKAALPKLEETMLLRKLDEKDTLAMTKVYKTVFETYPFPIHKQEYLINTMRENVIYYGIFEGDKLFAIASSETNKKYLNAEMTDFAILDEYRGKNLSLLLLWEMEQNMKKSGYKLLYTIARAVSYGMNSTFSKLGYQFSGTLVNNTNISGNIESMNLWYKILD